MQQVRLHPKGSKADQDNDGDHYQQHNFMVNSKVFPGKDMEFELSRHLHFKDKSKPYTVTAMFKETAEELYLEAYRILAEVCKGKELLPDWVAQQHQRARIRHRECSVFDNSDGVNEDVVLINDSDEELSGAKESQALPASLDSVDQASVLSSEQPGSASFTHVCQSRDELMEEYPRLRIDEVMEGLEKFREDQEKRTARCGLDRGSP